MLATSVFLLGLSLSPLCACLCESAESIASAAEAPGHSHHEHPTSSDPADHHSDDQADCIHLTATLPGSIQPISQSWRAGGQPMATVSVGPISILQASQSNPIAPHHPDRGPPIPPPLFTILRP